jgi:uncharacterized protein (TIGR03435 family)
MTRAVALFLVASVAAITAQSNQTDRGSASPTFEVASVRPIGSVGVGVFAMIGFPAGGHFLAQNAQLTALVRAAYPSFASPGRIVGGPDWVKTELFEINAKAAGDPPREAMNEMLKQLLAERFKLKVHVEPREVDAYALMLVRSDRRLGPGMRKATINCEAPPPQKPAPRECTWFSIVTNGAVRFGGLDQPLSRVVAHLQANVGRTVVDRTGLTGRFDIELKHAERAAPSATADPNAPAPIMTAIREQLGLKLESRKERMDVLVIDQVEIPTPN